MHTGLYVLAIGLFIGAMVWIGLVARGRNPPLPIVLREYVTIVPPRLVKLYGRSDEYTPARVDRALLGARVSTRFRAHAYALFCSHADFADHPACTGLRYEELRAKMLLIHLRYVARPWSGGAVPFDSNHGKAFGKPGA